MRNSRIALALILVVSLFRSGDCAGSGTNLQDIMNASYAAEASHDVRGAIASLKRIEATAGHSYLFNLRMGWLNYLRGDWAASIRYYRAAAAQEPEAIEPLQGLLLPLSAQRSTGEEFDAHAEILRLDPNNYKSLMRVGWLHYQSAQYIQAARFYSRVLRLYPTDTDAMLGLGYCLKKEGDAEGAKRAFRQVLLLSPKNQSALDGLK